VSIELHDSENDHYLLRSVLLGPDAYDTLFTLHSDIEWYYTTLIGLPWSVKVHVKPVSEHFSLSSIGCTPLDSPKFFPSYDVRAMGSQGRDKYFELIENILRVEDLQRECGIDPAQTNNITVAFDSPLFVSEKNPEWVNEILEALQTRESHTVNDENAHIWMIVPRIRQMRYTNGFRLLSDRDLGTYWGPRLPSTLFPDMEIATRFSPYTWSYINEPLFHSIFAFYKTVKECDDAPLTKWIHQEESELRSMFSPFEYLRNVALLDSEETSPDQTAGSTIFTTHASPDAFLHFMEDFTEKYIRRDVMELPEMTWRRLMNQILPINGFDNLDIRSKNYLEDTIREWVIGKKGLAWDTPLHPSWNEHWKCLFESENRGKSRERMELFLDFLQMITTKTTHVQKKAMIARWVKVFMEEEIVEVQTESISSQIIYIELHKWGERLFTHEFQMMFRPPILGPAIEKAGFRFIRVRQYGRVLNHLSFRDPRRNRLLTEEVQNEYNTYAYNQFDIPSKTYEESDGVIDLGYM
jgi:hypothetical protein